MESFSFSGNPAGFYHWKPSPKLFLAAPSPRPGKIPPHFPARGWRKGFYSLELPGEVWNGKVLRESIKGRSGMCGIRCSRGLSGRGRVLTKLSVICRKLGMMNGRKKFPEPQLEFHSTTEQLRGFGAPGRSFRWILEELGRKIDGRADKPFLPRYC